MLTLALTGIVPLTLDPEVGAVTVTIRLPPIGSGSGGSNCARTGCGAIKLQPTSAERAVA
jgi:hypothetical protein